MLVLRVLFLSLVIFCSLVGASSTHKRRHASSQLYARNGEHLVQERKRNGFELLMYVRFTTLISVVSIGLTTVLVTFASRPVSVSQGESFSIAHSAGQCVKFLLRWFVFLHQPVISDKAIHQDRHRLYPHGFEYSDPLYWAILSLAPLVCVCLSKMLSSTSAGITECLRIGIGHRSSPFVFLNVHVNAHHSQMHLTFSNRRSGRTRILKVDSAVGGIQTSRLQRAGWRL
jgi:hypothetical protein